jgi:hypothetical protein
LWGKYIKLKQPFMPGHIDFKEEIPYMA